MAWMLPKISSNRYGGKVAAVGILLGIVIPIAIWMVTRRVVWPLVVAGGAILAALCVLLAIEATQDSSPVPFLRRSLKVTVPYDPETQIPVIHASICTGERVAGFKNKADGHFTEVMLLTSDEDERLFMETYQIETIKTEY